MGDNFVLMTYSATRDKLRDKNRVARPPEVTLNDGFSTEATKVAQEGRVMDGVEQG